jgi:hypothetical protein
MIMPESQPAAAAQGPDGPEAEASLGDLAERGIKRIVTAIVIAGAIVGLAIYSRPGPPRSRRSPPTARSCGSTPAEAR